MAKYVSQGTVADGTKYYMLLNRQRIVGQQWDNIEYIGRLVQGVNGKGIYTNLLTREKFKFPSMQAGIMHMLDLTDEVDNRKTALKAST